MRRRVPSAALSTQSIRLLRVFAMILSLVLNPKHHKEGESENRARGTSCCDFSAGAFQVAERLHTSTHITKTTAPQPAKQSRSCADSSACEVVSNSSSGSCTQHGQHEGAGPGLGLSSSNWYQEHRSRARPVR